MAHVNLQSDMITLNASYSTRCSRSEEPSICMDKSSILGNGSTAKSEAFTVILIYVSHSSIYSQTIWMLSSIGAEVLLRVEAFI